MLNFKPTSSVLTLATLAPGASGAATVTFDMAADAEAGTGSAIELVVAWNAGDVFYFLLYLTIAAPPTTTRQWEYC